MIAGYIGNASAFSTLVDMTRRHEFVFGGFYTGVATAANGTLHRRRSLGSVSTFLTEHKGQQTPGTVGIAHSRTDDGGGIEWAQPRFDDNEILATVGVGIGGVLASADCTVDLAEALVKDGARFRTRIDGAKKNGIVLSDGGVVHGGEVRLFALARLYKHGYSIPQAVRKLDLRSESVGIVLSALEPDRLFVINYNSRLLAVSTPSATLLSSSRLALVDDAVWSMEIPPNTIAVVTRETVQCEVLVADEPLYDFRIPTGVSTSVIDYLRNNPGATWYQVLEQAVSPHFSKGTANLAFSVAHQVIERLLAEQTIRFEVGETTGLEGQSAVPEMQLYLA